MRVISADTSRLGVVERSSVPQPADGVEVVTAALAPVGRRVETQGHPGLHRGPGIVRGSWNPGGRTPITVAGASSSRTWSADDRAVPAEAAAPQPVAQRSTAGRLIRQVFRRTEGPTECRRHAEQTEVHRPSSSPASRRSGAPEPVRLADPSADAAMPRERPRLLSHVPVLRLGQLGLVLEIPVSVDHRESRLGMRVRAGAGAARRSPR